MIEITHQPLDPAKVTALVQKDTNGAVVTFLGTTRDNFEGKRVVTLEYEAFEEMALKKLEEVRQGLMVEFGVEDIAISHRIGRVDIGEISLVVAVASPHRKEAFLACHQAVDRLKENGPHLEKRGLRGRLALGRVRRPRIRAAPCRLNCGDWRGLRPRTSQSHLKRLTHGPDQGQVQPHSINLFFRCRCRQYGCAETQPLRLL